MLLRENNVTSSAETNVPLVIKEEKQKPNQDFMSNIPTCNVFDSSAFDKISHRSYGPHTSILAQTLYPTRFISLLHVIMAAESRSSHHTKWTFRKSGIDISSHSATGKVFLCASLHVGLMTSGSTYGDIISWSSESDVPTEPYSITLSISSVYTKISGSGKRGCNKIILSATPGTDGLDFRCMGPDRVLGSTCANNLNQQYNNLTYSDLPYVDYVTLECKKLSIAINSMSAEFYVKIDNSGLIFECADEFGTTSHTIPIKTGNYPYKQCRKYDRSSFVALQRLLRLSKDVQFGLPCATSPEESVDWIPLYFSCSYHRRDLDAGRASLTDSNRVHIYIQSINNTEEHTEL